MPSPISFRIVPSTNFWSTADWRLDFITTLVYNLMLNMLVVSLVLTL